MSRCLVLSILKLKIKPLLVKKSQDIKVFERTISHWVDDKVSSRFASLILSISVKVQSFFVFKNHLENHLIILDDSVHNWITTIRISYIDFGTELQETNQIVSHYLILRILSDQIDQWSAQVGTLGIISIEILLIHLFLLESWLEKFLRVDKVDICLGLHKLKEDVILLECRVIELVRCIFLTFQKEG